MFRVLWILALVVFVSLCFEPFLLAQVFEVGGGTSTLYQAGGGSIKVRAPNYDLTLGAGSIDGHILGGARLVTSTPHAKFTFGDDLIDFRLPTDIFDTSHFLLARGIGVRATRGATDIVAFAGATATDYNSPLFDGQKTNDPAGVLFLSRKLSPRWQMFSDTVISTKMSEIGAIQWKPAPKLALGLSAGVGANQPYAAASLQLFRKWIDIQAGYIEAGRQFHRVALASLLLAEPDRENILVTVRPFPFLSLTGAHQNYLVPQYPSTDNVRSSVDQGSAGLRILATQINGTIYQSSYQGESNEAFSLSAMRDVSQRFHVMSNYLVSHPKDSNSTKSFISTISEVISPRLTVNENVTTSGGQTGVTFCGEFVSNFVSINANYETFYVPANNSSPFEQALMFDVTMRLMGRLTLHGASFVDPTGHIRNTVDAKTIMWHGQGNSPLTETVPMEGAVLRGCVKDAKENPVEGAALLIDEKLVYTDSGGCFFLREHRPHTHTLKVALTDFLANGNWYVVSAPPTITSNQEKDNAGPPVIVVVSHVKTASATPDPAIKVPPSQ